MSTNALSAADASSIQQAQLQQQYAFAVLGKVHEAANQQAEAALALLDSVTQQIPDPAGQKGNQIDLTA